MSVDLYQPFEEWPDVYLTGQGDVISTTPADDLPAWSVDDEDYSHEDER